LTSSRALASLAGSTLVAAALTDEWEHAMLQFAELFGHGRAAERRLEATQAQLARATGADLELLRTELAQQWTFRFEDLLEDEPATATRLQALIEALRQTSSVSVTASDHSLSAGRDINISASGGGIAAGIIHGNVRPPGYPTGEDSR
jgi:hypothetical protein